MRTYRGPDPEPLCPVCTPEEQLSLVRAAVEKTRRELGIDPHHDCGADSGSLDESEERERSERGR